MKASHIILAGMAGTTAFTLFSYIVSRKQKQNFKEPELLGDMIDTTVAEVKTEISQVYGWGLHYLTGAAFSTTYAIAIDNGGVKPNFFNGIIVGAISGLAAIAWWSPALSLHPNPPRRADKHYFGHLFLGHIIFGTASFMAFRLLKKRGKKPPYIKFPIDRLSPNMKLQRSINVPGIVKSA